MSLFETTSNMINDHVVSLKIPSSHFTMEYGQRILHLVLPIQLSICYSEISQRLLFLLMKMMNDHLELKGEVMLHLIHFLEEMNVNNLLWINACESGFAILFLQHLLPILEEENKEAVAAFLTQKVTDLYQGLLSSSSSSSTTRGGEGEEEKKEGPNDNSNNDNNNRDIKLLMLQELLHTIAITTNFNWLTLSSEIIEVVKGIIGLCVPFSNQRATMISMKALLVCRTLLNQMIAITDPSIDLFEKFHRDALQCNECAMIVLVCEDKIGASSLNKTALAVLAKASTFGTDSADYICQNLVKYFNQVPTTRVVACVRQYILSCITTQSSATLAKLDPSLADLALLREIEEVLDVYLSISVKEADSYAYESHSSGAAAVAKFCCQLFFGAEFASALTLDAHIPADESNRIELDGISALEIVGSFVSKLVSILHKDYSILKGRSSCMILVHHVCETITLSCSRGDQLTSSVITEDANIALEFIGIFLKAMLVAESHIPRHDDIAASQERDEFYVSDVTIDNYIYQELDQFLTTIHKSKLIHTIIRQLIVVIELRSRNSTTTFQEQLLELSNRLMIGLESCVSNVFDTLCATPSAIKIFSRARNGANAAISSDADVLSQEIQLCLHRSNGLSTGITTVLTKILTSSIQYSLMKSYLVQLHHRVMTSFTSLLQVYFTVYDSHHSLYQPSPEVYQEVLLALHNLLHLLVTINEKIYRITLHLLSQHDISNKDNLPNNISNNIATVRLWIYLLLFKLYQDYDVKHSTAKEGEDVHVVQIVRTIQINVQKLSFYTFPILFGKLMNISQSSDIVDEIYFNDSFLQSFIAKNINAKISKYIYRYACFPTNGLLPHQILYHAVLQYIEFTRLEVSLDIRNLIGYAHDLPYVHNSSKKSTLSAIIEKGKQIWIDCINYYFARQQSSDLHSGAQSVAEAIRPEYAYSLEEMVGGSIQEGMSVENIEYNIVGNDYKMSQPRYWPIDQLRHFLNQQALFLLERCIHDEDEVQNVCIDSFTILTKSQGWLLTFNNTMASPNGESNSVSFQLFANLTKLEREYTKMISLNAHLFDPSGRYRSIADNDSNADDSSLGDDQYDELGNRATIDLFSLDYQATFHILTSLKKYLPATIIPQNEESLFSTSLSYFLFLYHFLSIDSAVPLRNTILTSFVNHFRSLIHNNSSAPSLSSDSLAMNLAEELLSSQTPVYHLYQAESKTGNNLGESNYDNPQSNFVAVGAAASRENVLDKARRKAAKRINKELVGLFKGQKQLKVISEGNNGSHFSALSTIADPVIDDVQMSKKESTSLVQLLGSVEKAAKRHQQAMINNSNQTQEADVYNLEVFIYNTCSDIPSQLKDKANASSLIVDSLTQASALLVLLNKKVLEAAVPGSSQSQQAGEKIILDNILLVLDTLSLHSVVCCRDYEMMSALTSATEQIYSHFPKYHSYIIPYLISILKDTLARLITRQQMTYAANIQKYINFISRLVDGNHIQVYIGCHDLVQTTCNLLFEYNVLINSCDIERLPLLSLLHLGLKLFRQHHIYQSEIGINNVRILRENILLALFHLFSMDMELGHIYNDENTQVRKRIDEGTVSFAGQEVSCYVNILDELLNDVKHYYVDYHRNGELYDKVAHNHNGGNNTNSTSSVVSENDPPISTSNRLINSRKSHTVSSAYCSPLAAHIELFVRLCKYGNIYKKITSQSQTGNIYTREYLPSDWPVLIASSDMQSILNNQRSLAFGISKGSNLISNKKKASHLLSSSGILTAIVFFIQERIDFLSARFLLNHYHENIFLKCALQDIAKLESWIDIKDYVENVKAFKQAVQATWIIFPRAAYLLQTIYPTLASQDGRKKGFSYIAAFTQSLARTSELSLSTRREISYHCVEVAFHQLLRNTNMSNAHKAELLEKIAYHSSDELLPLHVLLSLLSRHGLGHINQNGDDNEIFRLPAMAKLLKHLLPKYRAGDILFYLPQIIQLLRRDSFGVVFNHLIQLAGKDLQVCYRLLYLLQTEMKSGQVALHSTDSSLSKRHRYGFCRQLNGIDPLPTICDNLYNSLMSALPNSFRQYIVRQFDFFQRIVGLSSELFAIPDKALHKEYIYNQLKDVAIPSNTFLPTDFHALISEIDIKNGKPMQSAAKCPFLLSFYVMPWKGPNCVLQQSLQSKAGLPELAPLNTNFAFDTVGQPKRTPTKNGSPKRYRILLPAEEEEKDDDSPVKDNTKTMDQPQTDKKEIDSDSIILRSKTRVGIGKRLTHETSAQASFFNAPKKIQQSQQLSQQEISVTPSSPSKKTLRKKKKSSGFDDDSGSIASATSIAGKWQACIFKTNDDCRQDVLTLQVMRVMLNWFQHCGLDVHLIPYHVLSTRVGEKMALGGIIEVVANVHSRDQLGKAGYKTLLQYFTTQFGIKGSSTFLNAQMNFVKSLAGYSILCYLLHVKDRHNGNILIDSDGHIVHIDFGFILGISPGGNLGFEAAPFKLSKEMVDLLGGDKSEAFRHYLSLTVQAYLAVRKIRDIICCIVASYADADLPCFLYREDVLEKLRERFSPDLSDMQAAKHMEGLVMKAIHDWTGSAYDGVQKLQNNIYSAEWK